MKSQLHRDMEALTPNERGFLDVTPEEAREATARVVEAAGRMYGALDRIRDELGIRDDFVPLGIAVDMAPIIEGALALARG